MLYYRQTFRGRKRRRSTMMTTTLARVSLAVFLLAGNAQAGVLTKQIRFEKPDLARAPGGVLLTITGCRSIAYPGEPILPVYPACFIVPPFLTASPARIGETPR